MPLDHFLKKNDLLQQNYYLCTRKLLQDDLVAQPVEQYTFNVWVLGSSPSGITKKTSLTWGFLFPTPFNYAHHRLT